MFKITEYKTTSTDIHLVIRAGEEIIEESIRKKKFEKWLSNEGKLLWEMTYHEPGCKGYSMTLAEYWELSEEIIKADLTLYIKEKDHKLLFSLLHFLPENL